MSEISVTSNGLVTIRTGTTCSAQAKPGPKKFDKDIPDEYTITIAPEKTTAQELEGELKRCGILNVDPAELERLSGANHVYDLSEIKGLDEYLDLAAARSELNSAEIITDPHDFGELPLEKARDKVYLSALIKLHKSAILVDEGVVENLTVKKAHDKGYLKALSKLVHMRTIVTGGVIKALTLEMARDKASLQDFAESRKKRHVNTKQ